MAEKTNRRDGWAPGARSDGQSWERPRRPRGPDTPRWIQLAPIATLAAIACGAYFAFAPEAVDPDVEPASGTTSPRDPGTARSTDAGDGSGFEMLSATWGPIDATSAPAPIPPTPSGLTERQQHQNAFHAAARERWKGTEIFVRGGAR